jgi:anti-sigma28 factor (negative regulator of flagellin synthesis)
VHPQGNERGAKPAVSVASEDVRVGMEAARAADGVSEALVSALRAEVLSGRYRPAAEAVAERMLRELARWGSLGADSRARRG